MEVLFSDYKVFKGMDRSSCFHPAIFKYLLSQVCSDFPLGRDRFTRNLLAEEQASSEEAVQQVVQSYQTFLRICLKEDLASKQVRKVLREYSQLSEEQVGSIVCLVEE